MELASDLTTINISIRAKIKDLFFIPTTEKLIINPSKADEDLFKLADTVTLKLYKTLPYTPIAAIGHNFSYELEEGETFSIDIDFSAYYCKEIYKNVGASPGPVSLIQHSLFLRDDTHVILNLSFKMTEEKRILSMNYHYQVDNDSDKIKHALSKFYKNYQNSELTSSKLITKE